MATLRACIGGLQESLGVCQASLLFMHKAAEGCVNGRLAKVNDFSPKSLDIAICTTGAAHLLGDGLLLGKTFHHVKTSVQPMLLGFACHQVLREMLGKYDYYCYMEDDLRLVDPLFFVKLKWFTDTFTSEALLQPHRFETAATPPVHKLYIDGPVRADFSAKWQDITKQKNLAECVMGQKLLFERPSNPHSGCFFLNAAQMEIWVNSRYFLDGDTSFAGPLESAATLGIMKTFRLYKPIGNNAGFLELHHLANRYLNRRLQLPLVPSGL